MDEKKQIVIASAAVFISLILLYFLLSRPSPGKESPVSHQTSTKATGSKQWQKEEPETQASSGVSSGHAAAGDSVSPFSAEELARMKERDKENDVLIEKAAASWLTTMATNDSLTEKTREKYKLKQNRSYVEGVNARKQKNYPLAVKKFHEAIKSPDATPVAKYYSLVNIKTLALKMKDMELFILASRLEAKLIAEENLSIIGISKTEEHLEWVDSFEKLMKVRSDPAVLNELVQKRMDELKNKYSREDIEKMIFKEADRYEKIFKELMS